MCRPCLIGSRIGDSGTPRLAVAALQSDVEALDFELEWQLTVEGAQFLRRRNLIQTGS